MSDPWTRYQVKLLIELYKKYECLYNPNSPLYRNKYSRMEALESIAEQMSTIRPGTTANKIKMKLHCLRVQFHTNMRKFMSNSSNNCTTTTEAWWCFKDLMFLKDYVVLRKKMIDDGTYHEETEEEDMDFTNSGDETRINDVRIKEEEPFHGDDHHHHSGYLNVPPTSSLTIANHLAVYNSSTNNSNNRPTSNLRRRFFVRDDTSNGRNWIEDSNRTKDEEEMKSIFPLNLSDKSGTAANKETKKSSAASSAVAAGGTSSSGTNSDDSVKDQQLRYHHHNHNQPDRNYDGFVSFIADEFRRLSAPKKIELKKKILRAIIECQDE